MGGVRLVMSGCEEIQSSVCSHDGGVGGAQGRVGVVLLATDQTLEYELCAVLHPLGVGCHFSRVMMEDHVTPDTLTAMKERISESAKLILPTLGEEEIFRQLAVRQEDAFKTTPLTAALKGFKALGVKNIGLVTPYVGQVNDILIKYIEVAGDFHVTNLLTFNLIRDSEVASVTVESIKTAAITVGTHSRVEAVFISCTSLRTTEVPAAVEKIIKKPVTSSNLAMAWHCARMLGCAEDLSQKYGRLFGKLVEG